MASTCDACGYRNSEVCIDLLVLSLSLSSPCFNGNCCSLLQLKPGGRIPDKGKKITLCVKNVKDLSRDVIKVYSLFLLYLIKIALIFIYQ